MSGKGGHKPGICVYVNKNCYWRFRGLLGCSLDSGSLRVLTTEGLGIQLVVYKMGKIVSTQNCEHSCLYPGRLVT